MARTARTARTARKTAKTAHGAKGASYRIARVASNSPDPDAAADARDPALLAALEEAKRGVTPTSGRTVAEWQADNPLTPEERAEADALLDEWEEQDRAAGVVENASPAAARTPRGVRGRRTDLSGDLSGRLVVRFPKSLHRDLAVRAAEEGVSLNQLVLTYVSRGLGEDSKSA